MLSRIKHDTDNDIAIIDMDEPFDHDTLSDDDDVTDILPLIHDGLNLQTVANYQRKEFPELWQLGNEEDDETTYPRIVLPTAYREAVID